jgi:hypothetical protein
VSPGPQAEREAIIAFLQEEQVRFEAEADDERRRWGLSDKFGRLSAQASILRTVTAYIKRGDHLLGRED